MGLFDKFKKKKTKKETPSDFNLGRDKNINAFDNFNKSISSSNGNSNSDDDSLNDNHKLNFEFLENFINSNENTIVLKSNILLDVIEESKYKNGINIKSDNLVIDGNGYSIDARGKTRIFQINGNNITFKNIHFKNAFSDKGAVILNNGNSLKVEDCIFENNNAKNEGGVIYNAGDSLKIFKSIFKNNGSKWHGGVIYNTADNIQIEICKFFNNSVNGNASVLYNKKSSCYIINSKFNKNMSQGHGGVIYNNCGEISIIDSCFKEKNKKKNAGVIFNLDNGIICENTKFINNFSKSHGGAIYNDSGQFIASNSCIFENNVSHRQGGSIFNNESSSIKLNEVIVRSNHSKKSGGAIYNKSSLIINYSTFFKNSTTGEGGAIYNEAGFVELYNSNFVDNSAEKFAYTIFNNNFLKIVDSIIIDSNLVDTNNINNSLIYMESGEDNKLNMENNSFFIKSLEDKNVIFINGGYSFLKNNKFYMDSYGDDFYTVYNEDGELNLTKLKFYKMDNSFSIYSDDFICFDDFKTIVYDIFLNNALINDFKGKFIYNDNILKISGEEDNILKNIFEGLNSTIITKDEKLSDNINGFYHLESLIQSVDLDSVTDNELIEIFLDSDILMQDIEQNFYEGGIELDYDNLVLDGKGHTIDASNLSRIFYVTANNITLKNIKFINGKYHQNYLDNEYCGGAVIKAINNTSLSIINCEFINNNSRNSAGVIYNDGDSLIIEKSDFKNNKSVNNAGVIYNSNASLTIKDNCLFDNNSSGKCAGVIFNKSKQLSIKNNCSFSNNSSKHNGGVICDLIGNLLISDSVFKNNHSDNDGGVININHESLKKEDGRQLNDNESIFMDCIFQENSADSGGVVIHEGNLFLDSCSFINNNAQYNGGAIYTQIGGCLTLKDTCFSKNNCKFRGGAIYSFNSIFKAFKDCNFDFNIADQGGAIFYNGDLLNMEDCYFKMNKALGENGNGCGGAIFKSGNKSDNSIVKYCSFKRNNAYDGGAIYIQNSLIIENTIFQDNYSKVEGDSIFNLGNLNLKKCNFSAETKNTLVNYGQFNQINNEFDDNSDIINKK